MRSFSWTTEARTRQPRLLKTYAGIDPSLRVITLGRNFGQTAALKAGFDAA